MRGIVQHWVAVNMRNPSMIEVFNNKNYLILGSIQLWEASGVCVLENIPPSWRVYWPVLFEGKNMKMIKRKK